MKTIKKFVIFFLCLCLLAGVTACGEPEPEVPAATPSPEPTATPTPSPTPEPTSTPVPLYENPLTGEMLETDYTGVRPVAVMIENNHDSGTMITQAGISQAAFVYEMQVECTTRNMAVFMDISDVPAMYPIRSARSYFVSVALAYDAIYAHCGQSAEGLEFAYDVIDPYYVDNDDFSIHEKNCGWRIYDWPHYGEHGMCTGGEALLQGFAEQGTRTTHRSADYSYDLHFTENAAPQTGTVADSIRIVFAENKITEFYYNEELGGYTGFQWNSDYIDDNTGELAVFQNVLVLAAPTQTRIDMKAHSAITTTNYAGCGWFMNGGYAEPITWERGGYEDCFHYYGEDGNPLELGIGHTYVAFTSEYYGAEPILG